MSEQRDGRCGGYKVTIFINNVELLSGNRKDTGCVGEQHTFTTTTTIPAPVDYEWSLDGLSPLKPVLSTDSYYTYTFDNKTHVLYLKVRNSVLGCSIQTAIDVIGRNCVPVCPVECRAQSANIPTGQVQYLVDEIGTRYPVNAGTFFDCKPLSDNSLAVEAIISAIKIGTNKCDSSALEVKAQRNFSKPNCITLMIRNSPIKFTRIVVNEGYYSFNNSFC